MPSLQKPLLRGVRLQPGARATDVFLDGVQVGTVVTVTNSTHEACGAVRGEWRVLSLHRSVAAAANSIGRAARAGRIGRKVDGRWVC